LGDRYSIGEPSSARDFPAEYLGKDTVLNRPVLIKCDRYKRDYGDSEQSPVATEALTTASFVHPAIPRVFDLAHDPELGTYSVLEHVPGIPLRDQIKDNRPLPVADAIDLMLPVCEAVHYTNEHGLIHRNIKPGSIVVDENRRPFLTNFIVA